MKEIDKSSYTRADVFIFSENMDKALKAKTVRLVNPRRVTGCCIGTSQR